MYYLGLCLVLTGGCLCASSHIDQVNCKIRFSISKLRIRDQQEASSSSSPQPGGSGSSLLAEHHKRHSMFYLSSEKSDPDSEGMPSDYPPANDLVNEISVDPFNPKKK